MTIRVSLPRLSLKTQILAAIFTVLIVVVVIGGILESRNELAEREMHARQQARQTSQLVSTLLSEPLAAGDRLEVGRILYDIVSLSPAPAYVEVQNPDGSTIVTIPEDMQIQEAPLAEARSDIFHDGASIGHIIVKLVAEEDRISKNGHVFEAVLFLALLLSAACLFFLFFLTHLVLRPLARIKANMAATLRGDPIAPGDLPRFAAKEMVALSTSAEALETALRDRDQREEDLRAAHRALEAANKAKSEFLANMSHEIRTPMNGVLGMAELLLETDLNSEQRVYAETIAKSGAALLPIINDVLDYSKMEAGKLTLHPEPFDLHRTIEDVVTMISAKAYQKEVEINFRYDPDLPKGFVADVGRVRQVLTNIVGNAVKFTFHGHVLIDVTGRPVDRGVSLQIEVSDTGIGIPPDRIDAIFDEFEQSGYRPATHSEGTGLGLSISSRLIRMMGGTIEARSTPGTGSVFTIRLVLKQTAEVDSGHLVVDTNLANRRMLIVDDMKINRTILSERLRNWGVHHEAVNSGSDALEVLAATAQAGGHFDAIIVDYHMPRMNGCELAAKIRELEPFKEVPIVLLSSVDVACEPLSDNPTILEIYLLKPVRSDTLKAVLANAVTKKGTETMPEPERSAPASSDSSLRKKTVLIAEDNKTNQLVLQTMLKTLEVRVITVENGQEAVKCRIENEPDIILMDMAMPVMDGLDATRKIREFEESEGRERTPIIALTANAMTGDRENCLKAGMDDYLSKPVIRSNLLATMERWVSGTSHDTEGDAAAEGANRYKDGSAKAS